jgi:hypothetical protein
MYLFGCKQRVFVTSYGGVRELIFTENVAHIQLAQEFAGSCRHIFRRTFPPNNKP